MPIPVLSPTQALADLVQFSKVLIFRDYVVESCKNLKAVFALNDAQKKYINTYYQIPIEYIQTIGGGYDSDIFYKPGVKSPYKNVKIIYAGKLSFSKGVPSLIRAFEKLQSRNQDVELLLAGTGCGGEEKEIINQIMASSANIKIFCYYLF
jgi:glycosyltransferase involved in cell wall biosynthesis